MTNDDNDDDNSRSFYRFVKTMTIILGHRFVIRKIVVFLS